MRKVPNRNVSLENISRNFSGSTIASQLQGMEVEFDDKVNLFPAEVEKRQKSRRSNVRRLRG